MEDPAGDKAEGMQTRLAPLCLPKCNFEESTAEHEIILSWLGCRSLLWREAWAFHDTEVWVLMMVAPSTQIPAWSLPGHKTSFEPC